MPRAKTPMGLIPFPKKRAATFARRKETVMKMAKELSVLCDAQVAVVVGDPGGGAAEKAAWESEEGVRAKRSLTHREYLRGELRKQRAKLAKVREEGAFKPWDDALDGIAEEETRKLHKYLSDKIEAARARMEAMGLQLGDVDDNGVNGDDGGGLDLQQHVPPSASDAKEFESVPVPLAFSTAGADFINAPNNFLTTGVSVSDYSVQSSGYGIGNQIDNAKQLLYQMQMQYPVGGTGGAEPSNTQTQSPDLRSFSNVVGDYSYTAAQSSANRLDQMHHPVGGRGSTGGAAADPSDTQSKNRGS
uniref:MADS-box domain-containing protein n=1 Tax=Oryza barthii TaxID=65489 RepID=A0A0D3ENE0_9ORYZ